MNRHLRSDPRPALLRLGFVALATVLLFAGCAAASPSGNPDAASSLGADPPAGAPATTDPDAPVGTDLPPGGGDPGTGDPAGPIVVPRPGQLDVAPIPADSFAAAVDGRRVAVTITFTSGVEPCYVLDSIVVQRGERTFGFTLRQGRGPGDNVCIEIAQVKRTVVDLGELEPGTYTITDALGGAQPITVVVP